MVQFYEADAFIVDAVADFIGAGLRAGEATIVVATLAHRADLDARFHAQGLDLAAARANGQYVSLDAAELLSRLLVDGTPAPQRFQEIIGGIIAGAAEGRPGVRVFGEMVALLAAEGNPSATIRLEELWNDLQTTHGFSLFCAYPIDRLGEASAELLGDVCAAHSSVVPAESYTTLPTPDARLRQIAVLQEKASRLAAEIAERERAEERLRVALASERAAREAAEAALRVRDEFLSIAAHELKTPLTSLSGQVQLLLRRLQRGEQVEPTRLLRTLQVIAGQSSKLSRLLVHLLDVSRLEAGKLSLERQPTDLGALVAQIVTTADTWSERHPVTLHAPASLGAEVDPLRLEQVLTNLLDNAVKYSPEGGPIEVVLTQPTSTLIELSVRDRGLGIPPEQRDAIFERYYQAHARGHRSGLGLGLYVSRQIVELHGGEIHADFPPDGGTRFTVRLPLAPPEPPAPSISPLSRNGTAGSDYERLPKPSGR
jgi:signal transduction histidine kinase